MYSFPDLEPIFVPCPVLTVAFWPAYRFLMSQVRRSGSPISKNFPQFVVIHTVKRFGIVNKAEVDVFLELSCFFDDPADYAGNLIPGSSAFSKTSLNIWKFTVHILLKPGLDLWVCSDGCMLCLVAQSCPTVCDPMDYSTPSACVYGASKDKNTGVGYHAFLQTIFPTQGFWTQLSCTANGFFTVTREAWDVCIRRQNWRQQMIWKVKMRRGWTKAEALGRKKIA